LTAAAAAPELDRAAERHRRLRAQGLLWRRDGVTLRRCRRGLVAFMTQDRFIGTALEHMGEVNERDFSLLRALVRPGDWVVDVGANIGVYALFFARRVGPTGRVLSVEPQPRIARLLTTNMGLNAQHHVLVWQGAFGEAPGRLQLPAIDYEREQNFGGIALKPRSAGIDVKVRTVDSVNLERCDFIKMDVEGMEPAVFAGAVATIRKFRPVLWMEADRPGAAERLAALARSEGYRCWELLILGERERNFYRKPQNIFVERYGHSFRAQEVLALPPGRAEPSWVARPPDGVTLRRLG
jgi:FkbM family methyltransferase